MLYARAGAAGLTGLLRGLQKTCTLVVEGANPLRAGDPVIFAYWHEWAIAGFVFLLQPDQPLACLCHPSPKLSPWVELGRRNGWRVVLGSTGHGGREASTEIVRELRSGLSTFVCPDGPAGPPHELRFGALHMAAQSGAPIVPVRFECARTLRLPSWDRMRVPVPGSTIRAKIGRRIKVGDDLEGAASQLRLALG